MEDNNYIATNSCMVLIDSIYIKPKANIPVNYDIHADEMNIDKLISDSVVLIEFARGLANKNINMIQLMTYYVLGKWIIEVQQEGKDRAKYGDKVIEILSKTLTEKCGKGFSKTNLKYFRQFYLTYQDRISQTLFDQFTNKKSQTVSDLFVDNIPFKVSWSHYLQLMRIKNEEERSFYEIEAANSNWGIRTLQRKYNSSLYERLALSRDKGEVIRLSKEGNIVRKPQDIVKQPTVLEFLGLEEKTSYSETDLETAIIDKLQKFLLELGKGYLFEARQKRFTFDEDNYYVDLGQMQMYVNYYDRYEIVEGGNPTIGILLCSEKKDSMIEMTLPKDANIYASEYNLYLPDKKLLQDKLKEWIAEERDVQNREN